MTEQIGVERDWATNWTYTINQDQTVTLKKYGRLFDGSRGVVDQSTLSKQEFDKIR